MQNGAESSTEAWWNGTTGLVLSSQAPPTNGGWPMGGQIAIAVLAFFTTAINGVTLVAIIKISSIRPKMKLLTGSLTTVDLLLGLSLLLPRVLPLDGMSSRHPLCFIRTGLVILSTYATCLTVLTMATDRTIAVVFPHFYRYQITFGKLVGCMVGVWVLVTLLTVASLVGGFQPDTNCTLMTSEEKVIPLHGIAVLGVVMMICVLMVTLCYVTVGVTMKKQHIIRSAMTAQTQQQSNGARSSLQRSERKMTITILCLALCFLIGYGPLSIICLMWAWQPDWRLTDASMGLAIFLCSMLGILLDPLIYFWRLRQTLARWSCYRCCPGTHRVAPFLEAEIRTSDPSATTNNPRVQADLSSKSSPPRGRLRVHVISSNSIV